MKISEQQAEEILSTFTTVLDDVSSWKYVNAGVTVPAGSTILSVYAAGRIDLQTLRHPLRIVYGVPYTPIGTFIQKNLVAYPDENVSTTVWARTEQQAEVMFKAIHVTDNKWLYTLTGKPVDFETVKEWFYSPRADSNVTGIYK